MAYPEKGSKEEQALKEAIAEVKKAQEAAELASLRGRLAKISELLGVVQV